MSIAIVSRRLVGLEARSWSDCRGGVCRLVDAMLGGVDKDGEQDPPNVPSGHARLNLVAAAFPEKLITLNMELNMMLAESWQAMVKSTSRSSVRW
eukprot:2719953-Rhodomonas_salina.1